ncbi:serine/threonine protein kinase [Altererythrobacter sp. B11]|uniref:serine/threonine-protein kinase n=1 Tax=Altererythrobacter sp. B11 TaxID=2060312 RepID=UPI000DC702BA|nr:serine/threonine-protein kinase [Altererythrobacter sp. B11]BBC73646.1 serine/threonine protein kinase [Altererythrobacter sp. B11]
MTMLGRYQIESRLGAGAMAEVYRATDPEIGRTVAIKVLKQDFAGDEQLAGRFLREARAAGALSHANIATIYDVGQVEGASYIAMELVEGRPLDEVLHAQGRMPYERVLRIARQLGDALAYAHGAGVVHRDIKPSNILISEDGRTAKLVDFGVARVGDLEGAGLAQTQAGQLIGTPRYMSPEQALGLPVDHRSDLFSLGVVLYEMITGRVAFPGNGLGALAIKIAQEKVEPVGRIAGDCPSGLQFIIDKLLAKKPDQRFADGAALVAALDREIHAAGEAPGGRRGLTLRVKLPLALVAVTALALFACMQLIWSRQEAALESMAAVAGESIAAFVAGNAAVVAADNAGLPPQEQDWTSVQAFVASATQDQEVRAITVADAGGVVRAASQPGLVGRAYQPQSGAGAPVGALRFVRPIDYAGARFGTVEITLGRTALDQALATSRQLIMALSAVLMIVVLVVGYLSGALVTRPLRRLRNALDDAARNGFALRISHNRRDEFGQTFDAFNRAAAEAEAMASTDRAGAEAAMLATRIAA